MHVDTGSSKEESLRLGARHVLYNVEGKEEKKSSSNPLRLSSPIMTTKCKRCPSIDSDIHMDEPDSNEDEPELINMESEWDEDEPRTT